MATSGPMLTISGLGGAEAHAAADRFGQILRELAAPIRTRPGSKDGKTLGAESLLLEILGHVPAIVAAELIVKASHRLLERWPKAQLSLRGARGQTAEIPPLGATGPGDAGRTATRLAAALEVTSQPPGPTAVR